MSVRPQELENPERDLDLETREGRRGRKKEWADKRPDEQRPEAPEASPDAEQLRARLDFARHLKPGPMGRHWWECWRAGRDVAVAAIEAGGIEAGRAVQAPEGLGCRDCFTRGRDAVVRTVEGV